MMLECQMINYVIFQIFIYHIVVFRSGIYCWKGGMGLMQDLLPKATPANYLNL